MSLILNIIVLVLWLFVGLFNLTAKKQIDKFSYGLVWFTFIMNIVFETIKQSLS